MGPTATKIKAAAIEKAGFSDFGADHSDDALEAWADDLDSPKFNDSGRAAFASLMAGDLARRLRVVDCLKQHPEIDQVEIPPILYISGLERTGTTFLHNLLSLPDNARPLLRWELMRPTPPPDAVTYKDDPRIALSQAAVDKLRGTMLERMHWVNADDPEECQWGMIDGSSILGASVFPIMPNWAAWYAQRDMEAAFTEYRKVMKLLLWKNPVPEGGHLVLKCPQFCDSLAAFAAVFPEARFALLHRDPFRAAVSLSTMLAGILSPFLSDANSLSADNFLAKKLTDRIEVRVPHLAAFSDANANIVNVAYPDLVQMPGTTADIVYETLGFAPPSDFQHSVRKYTEEQKQGKRAKPPQALPTHGLDHETFLSRATIAAYCARFQIKPEQHRQTGV